jgi:hypothetical protein
LFFIAGDVWQCWHFWQFPITLPLPPGFHPISPRLTQCTQESAEGHNPKIQKPGYPSRVFKNLKSTCERRRHRLQLCVQIKYETTLTQFFCAATKNLRPSAYRVNELIILRQSDDGQSIGMKLLTMEGESPIQGLDLLRAWIVFHTAKVECLLAV